jgi:pimeloyl-ACP methyl ester carboxylesterase
MLLSTREIYNKMKRPLSILIALLIFGSYASSQQNTPLWKTLPDLPPMPKADESGLAPVNDIKMYYAIFNEEGKDPVILLHGGLVSSDYWSFEVPLLSKTNKVIIVDSRGHGRSTMSDQPFSYNLIASDVLQILEYLKIKKVSIVGWSDGGIIGLILAIKNPERVNKLFTFGTNFNLSGYKSESSDATMSSRFMARVQANYREHSPTPDNFAGLMKALGKMYSTEPDLKPAEIRTIKAPTIIAYGEYEQFIKREHFQILAQLIPGARLVMLPNVSHGGPLQDPAHFHEAVMMLLDANK